MNDIEIGDTYERVRHPGDPPWELTAMGNGYVTLQSGEPYMVLPVSDLRNPDVWRRVEART